MAVGCTPAVYIHGPILGYTNGIVQPHWYRRRIPRCLLQALSCKNVTATLLRSNKKRSQQISTSARYLHSVTILFYRCVRTVTHHLRSVTILFYRRVRTVTRHHKKLYRSYLYYKLVMILRMKIE